MNYCRNCASELADAEACRCGAPPLAGRRFCDGCANPTYPEETECPNCGNKLDAGQPAFRNTIVASNPPKDPSMMAALSFIPLPWLGQIFMGQTTKGITMLLVTVVASVFLIGLILPFVAAYDAYRLAQELREGRSIGPWDFFWSIPSNAG